MLPEVGAVSDRRRVALRFVQRPRLSSLSGRLQSEGDARGGAEHTVEKVDGVSLFRLRSEQVNT